MRTVPSFFLSAAALPAFLSACAAHEHFNAPHVARQAPPAPPALIVTTGATTGATPTTSLTTASGASSLASSAASSTASGVTVSGINTTMISVSSLPTASFSLEATNPTAVPLSSIFASMPSAPTSPLSSIPTPGTVPAYMPNAPPLPNVALLQPSNYPPLDKVPDISSPEVQQWITEVHNSGVLIPNIQPNQPGGCPANPAAASNASNCWWTCGGCTRQYEVTECPSHDEWGLTYDDGPAYYTTQLLDYLDQVNLKSTFFVVGSRVISFPSIAQAEYLGQNQIAVHTWSHPPLTTLTNEQIIAELGWSKKVIKDVIGVTPNMMRPPYGDIDDRVRAICIAMGLRPVIWSRVSSTATFDTGDFNIAGGTISVSEVLYNWENIVGNASTRSSGFIVLEHDLFQQSVDVATGYILPDAIAHQFDIKPVISCLNMPMQDAYIELNDNSTNPPLIDQGVVSMTSTPSGYPLSTGKSGSSPSLPQNIPGLVLAVTTTLIGLVIGMATVL